MISEADVEIAAKALYMTHWKELPNGRSSPIWENASEEVRDWTRKQAADCLAAVHHSSVGEAG